MAMIVEALDLVASKNWYKEWKQETEAADA